MLFWCFLGVLGVLEVLFGLPFWVLQDLGCLNVLEVSFWGSFGGSIWSRFKGFGELWIWGFAVLGPTGFGVFGIWAILVF